MFGTAADGNIMALHDHDQRHRNDPERTSRKRPERGYYVTLDDPFKVYSSQHVQRLYYYSYHYQRYTK